MEIQRLWTLGKDVCHIALKFHNLRGLTDGLCHSLRRWGTLEETGAFEDGVKDGRGP